MPVVVDVEHLPAATGEDDARVLLEQWRKADIADVPPAVGDSILLIDLERQVEVVVPDDLLAPQPEDQQALGRLLDEVGGADVAEGLEERGLVDAP